MMSTYPRVLLTFCGTGDPGCNFTTIGDVVSIYNVAKGLINSGIQPKIAWTHNLYELSSFCVDINTINPNDVDILVYICGPLRNVAGKLAKRFEKSKKIAIGVSILDAGGSEKLFDQVLPRDSLSITNFDLALADIGWPHKSLDPNARVVKISLCLAGNQSEYNISNQYIFARNRLFDLVNKHWPEFYNVSTVLTAGRADLYDSELDVQMSDTLVTTRMHGFLFGAFHKLNIIVFDQIIGGAKVSRIANRVGIKVHNILELSMLSEYEFEKLINHEKLISYEERIRRRETIISHSRAMLNQSIELISSSA